MKSMRAEEKAREELNLTSFLTEVELYGEKIEMKLTAERVSVVLL